MFNCLLLIPFFVFSAPKPALWPPSFSVDFDKTLSSPTGTQKWKNRKFYDAPNKKSRTDMLEGHQDPFCFSVIPSSKECRQIVNGDWRYFVWPGLENKCCKCCNVSAGCGILSQDWISGGKYAGKMKWGNMQCDGWSKQGRAINTYYAYNDHKQEYDIPCGIVMNQTNPVFLEVFEYNITTYTVGEIDPNIFKIPSGCEGRCEGKMCSLF